MLPTIEISSIIIAFSSHSDNLICVLFWSDIADRTSPVLLGIANAVLMFVPAMFIAATPVDAASKTVGFLACVQPPLTSKNRIFFRSGAAVHRLLVSQDSLEHVYRFLLQCGRLF